MWTSPYRWFRDKDGNLTSEPGRDRTPLIDNMPLVDAVKLGIADKDGNAIVPKEVTKSIKAKKE